MINFIEKKFSSLLVLVWLAMKGFPNPSNPFSFEGNDAFERCSFLNVCDSWPESPRWPITVTAIKNTSRENQTPHDKNNYFKAKPNTSRQKEILDGKTNRLTAEPKAHGKNNYFTANPNTSQQNQYPTVNPNTSRYNQNPTAKEKHSRQDQKAYRRSEMLTGREKPKKRYCISGYWTLTVCVNAALLGLLWELCFIMMCPLSCQEEAIIFHNVLASPTGKRK